uniref:Crooked neck-like protein 1 n=2 Tax=Parascaris univalens TaxID=6257 RepID=A0A915AQ20_PARUN
MDDFEETPGNKPLRLPKKAAKVKNKAPAALQITAEQLVREAKERDLEIVAPPPKTKISDPEELAEYQRKRRKEFEDNIRKNRNQIANWVKYAKWEENIGEMQRARSVFERALDVDHRSITLWLQYAEMEMRNKQVNHARNIWDRAVTILPRATQFWLKYSYMEELIGNLPGARQVFERWMEWEPPEQAWQTYINFELRYKETDRARIIWQRFLHVHGHDVKLWIRYARFEERSGYIGNARAIYERGVEYFGEDNIEESLLIAFAQFEERQKEHERARVIYRYGLDHLPSNRTAEIFKYYTIHEKKYGERAGIENVIVSKRRFQYEKQIAENPFNYDAWFDYIRLLQNEKVDREEMEDTFERAIANVPPQSEKRYWRRYIYLWINYVLYEELEVEDIERTRAVYKTCMQIIPHKKFTFSKIWIMFAHFEVRQLQLRDARKIMGNAIGMCPREKLFRSYVDLELQLREFDRCRILYGKFLEYSPENSSTWIKFAELETLLGDIERARAIFALAVQQPALDMPEVLWKAYIDFEINQEEYVKARRLYESLLERTTHIKVWISMAEFELHIGNINAARAVYERANRALANGDKEERLILLESWLNFEQEHGDATNVDKISKLMPKKVKKRRQIQTEDGLDAGWEEYFDYIFPDDQASKGSLKLLEAARRWKEKMAALEEPLDRDEPKREIDESERDDENVRNGFNEREKKIREGDSDTDISDSSSETDSDSDSSSSSSTSDSIHSK